MAISSATRKKLWSRAHDRCSFPTCSQPLTSDVVSRETGRIDVVVIGEEAHIRAQSAGGPRYDPTYSEDQVDSYDNLILLCANHHTMVDANGGAGYDVLDLLAVKKQHELNRERRTALEGTIAAYVGDRYEAENSVRFQQADLHGPSVESMFVDVAVGHRRDGSSAARFMSGITTRASPESSELASSIGFIVVGAARLLLDPAWNADAVLLGGPGQGKSTLLQFVCQSHRARRLGRGTYSAEARDTGTPPPLASVPIRIDLRDYAQWAKPTSAPSKKRRRDQPQKARGERWRSLEEYVVRHVGDHAGGRSFRIGDLAALIATEPVLLALDGLDEVAHLPTRIRVTEEIIRARARLRVEAMHLQILVASRPGTALQPLTAATFALLHLQRLTPDLRLQYLERWVHVAGLTENSAARLRSSFLDNQDVPHIRELASYPMQLAILLHLLHRRQLLPQQRTELYAEYLKTFLDREQTEDKEPLLADQRRVIEDTHAYLGWYLQSKAEQGQSDGTVAREELRQLLRKHLEGQTEDLELAEQLYSAITTRVLCLIERNGTFEFEVQSLREYFAALHLFDNLTTKGVGNSRDDGLNALLERPYWSNVCRFFVGMLAKGEVRALKHNLTSASCAVEPHPMIRSMALLILNDQIYAGPLENSLQEVVDLVLAGGGVVLAEDGMLDPSGSPVRFRERAGRKQAVTHLKRRLETGEDENRIQAVAACLLAHRSDDEDLQFWWWAHYEPTVGWLRTASELRALSDLDAGRTELLIQLVRGATSPRLEWWVELLMRGGYNGSAPELLAVCHEELNQGAAGAPGLLPGTTVLHQEAQKAAAAWTINDARVTITPGSGEYSLTTLWFARLRQIAQVWGDGWVLRRATLLVPEKVDLTTIPYADEAATSSLRTALEIVQQSRLRSRDAHWWRDLLSSAPPAPEQLQAIILLFEQAPPTVFLELADVIDSAVQRLEPKEYQLVESILKIDTSAQRVRELVVDDAIRLQTLKLSAPTMWLVWHVGTTTTRIRSAVQLRPQLTRLFATGLLNGQLVLESIRSHRKVSPADFVGARRLFPQAGSIDMRTIGKMPNRLAEAVLASPEMWPSALVQLGLEHYEVRMSTHTKPLVEVAVANSWFSGRD